MGEAWNVLRERERERERFIFMKLKSFLMFEGTVKCFTSLLSFYNKVIEAVGQDENYGVVYVDFSKVFDKVPHWCGGS